MSGKDYNVMARFSVGDSLVPISQFSIDFPSGVLGSRLTCEVADVSVDPSSTDPVLFEVGVGLGTDLDWVTMMDLGVVGDKTSVVKWLDDSKRVQAISRVADRWKWSPPRAVFVFDPDIIDPVSSGEASPRQLVNEQHSPIFPELVAIPSLDITQLLQYIYVEKLGFSRVITNIENFRLNFVSISISSPFHAAAVSELGVFQPEFFSDDVNVLWIIDPQGTLPVGLSTRLFRQKHYAEFQQSQKTTQRVNAVVLSYHNNFTSGSITSRVEQESKEVGTPFSPGWQRTTVSRFINDFHDNPGDDTEVTRSVVTRTLTQTSAFSDGLTRLVLTEDQTDAFLYDFRLKAGFIKSTSIYCRLPGESAKVRLVQTETNQIVWQALGNSGEFIKRYEVTNLVGTIIKVFNDPDDPDAGYTAQSAFGANKFDQIPEEVEDGTEVLTGQPISTQIDTYRNVGQDQIEVTSQRISHLSAGAPADQSRTFEHTGTIQVRAATSAAMQTNMLITRVADGDHLRNPVQLSAGNVPFDIAKRLALRILERQGNEPASVSVELTGLDLAVRRGSIRRVELRDGSTVRVFVTGYRVTGTNLGSPNFGVTMTVDGLVIPNA